jgi:hypothetical protein
MNITKIVNRNPTISGSLAVFNVGSIMITKTIANIPENKIQAVYPND